MLIILFTSLPLSAIPVNASPFSGGDGSEQRPYLVSSPEALDAVRNDPSAHYQQTCDIDMSGRGIWEPIEKFTGVYDGRNFEIKNIIIVYSYKVSTATPYGLFATAQGAAFKNMRLVDLNIDIDEIETDYQAVYTSGLKAELIVGGICGEASNIVREGTTTSGTPSTTIFDNCSVSGNISVTNCANVTVGGIVGSGAKSITYCNNYADIFIDANRYYSDGVWTVTNIKCGGISGDGDMFGSSVIEYCSNSGSIEGWSNGSAYTAGICSGFESANISYCVNFGSIFCRAQKELMDISYNSFSAGGIATSNNARYCVNYGKVSAYGEKPKYNATSLSAGGITATGKASYCYNISSSIIGAYFNEYNIVEFPNGGSGRITGNLGSGVTFSGDYSYSSNQTMLNEVTIKTNTYETSTFGREYDPENGFDLTPEELLLEKTYSEFDFTNTWVIDPSVGGPVLRDISFVIDDDIPIIEQLDFAEYKYRADYLLSTTFTENTFRDLFTTNEISPAKIIIDEHPKGMQTAAEAWDAMSKAIKAANDGPGDLMKDDINQHNLIIAYIMQALKYQTQEIVAEAIKTGASDVDGFVKMSEYIVNGFYESNDSLAEHAANNSEEIKKALLEQSQKTDSSMKKLLDTKEFTSLINTIAGISKDYRDLYDRINSYAMLYASTEETKAIVNMMYDLCPASDKEIKGALASVKEIMEAASDELFKKFINGQIAFTTITTAGAVMADLLWDEISAVLEKTFPGVAALCMLANAEMYVVDKFFGVNKTVEQYFKLCTLNDLDALSGKVVEKAIDNYRNERTTDNAKVMLGAIELKFGFIDESYRESIKYSELIHDEGIIRGITNAFASWLGINENTLKDSLLKGVNVVNELHRSSLTMWIYQLENDYPLIAPLYDEYKNGIDQSFAAKQISVHCPVNVKVYDESDTLVAEVGEDQVWASGEIAVVYDHGEKDIYFFDNAEHRIVCEGFDTGDMDIEVNEFDADGNLTHTVNYNNIPVSAGSTHNLSASSVSDAEGNTLEADYDSSNTDAAKYKVTVNYGVIAGYLFEYEASAGERIEITALVPEGYRFVGWQGDIEFEDAKSSSTYFFMPEGDISISAKLKKIEDEDDDDENKPRGGLPIIWIIVGGGAALISVSGIAILIVMIKEKSKKRSKENRNETDTL